MLKTFEGSSMYRVPLRSLRCIDNLRVFFDVYKFPERSSVYGRSLRGLLSIKDL